MTPAPDTIPPGRLRQLFLDHSRNELLAQTESIAELSLALLEQAEGGDADLRGDLQKVHEAARSLSQAIRAVKVPLHRERLEHELRSKLTIIIGYTEELLQNPSATALGERRDDLLFIWKQGRLSLAPRVGELVAYLTAEGVPAGLDAALDFTAAARRLSGRRTVAESQFAGRVLVADDNVEVQSLMVHLLRRMGHQAEVVGSGSEALRAIEEQPFDLVLLDILMPPPNGLEVLSRIKEPESRHRELPVLMVSAFDAFEAAVRGIEMGADDYLPKPLNAELFQARVTTCLEKHRLRRRYAEVLQEVLPPSIVHRRVQGLPVPPQRRENVAVLFADIKGFTPFCDTHSPEEVVAHLQHVFPLWDQIAQNWGVQKIKTIGDAFMAAAGLMEDVPNPVLSCVRCGLKMIESLKGHAAGWSLRVGVHVGPVVAGLIGSHRYLYDLWGDTVNVAARIESHGQPGCVNLSEAAWKRIADQFEGIGPPTRLRLKGKEHDGEIPIYHLNPDTIQETTSP